MNANEHGPRTVAIGFTLHLTPLHLEPIPGDEGWWSCRVMLGDIPVLTCEGYGPDLAQKRAQDLLGDALRWAAMKAHR